MNDYEQKKQARIDRYRDRAEKAEKESERRFKAAHDAVKHIPFGQPILVGHHSEAGHRATLKRSHNHMDKGCEAYDKAKHYVGKAWAAENNNAISSDDPEAIDKLKEKLEKRVKLQAQYKTVNKIVKRKKGTQEEKIKELEERGIKDAVRLFDPDFSGRIGIPSYALSNNNANIRRIKQRIEQLEKAVTEETVEKKIGHVTITDNVEKNRVQIFFPGKPEEKVRTWLKQHGFRWSQYNGCWQLHRSNRARYFADEAVKVYEACLCK